MKSKKPELLVIDGHNQIYRAIFSSGPVLRSASGEITKGVYIFLRMLFKLVAERKPEYFAIAMDRPREELYRRKIYPQYKTTRGVPDVAIIKQVKRIKQILRLLDVCLVDAPTYEADDVIATLACQLKKKLQVTVVSNDKDMHQVVGKRVRILDPYKGTYITEEEVMSRWSVAPERVQHVQALCGDGSDDIEGVPHVGELTAKKLIAKYGTVQGVYENRRRISERLRIAIENTDLNLMLDLTTLKTNIEIDCSLERFRFKGFNKKAASHVFAELGFRRWATGPRHNTQKSKQ